MLWPFGVFSGHLVHFLVIWCIFWSFGKIFPRFGMLYQENLATLDEAEAKTVFRTSRQRWIAKVVESYQENVLKLQLFVFRESLFSRYENFHNKHTLIGTKENSKLIR
jgi:hypothetical protein